MRPTQRAPEGTVFQISQGQFWVFLGGCWWSVPELHGEQRGTGWLTDGSGEDFL